MTEQPLNHVRVIDRLGGRRLNDWPGQSHTICGGSFTAYDVLYRDAKSMTEDERRTWIRCETCRALPISVRVKPLGGERP